MSRSALCWQVLVLALQVEGSRGEFCSPEDLAQDYTLNIAVFRVQGGGLF